MRTILLRLVEAAPDPCGFEKTAPLYQEAWDKARTLLAETCPTKHRDNGSATCADCHADLAH